MSRAVRLLALSAGLLALAGCTASAPVALPAAAAPAAAVPAPSSSAAATGPALALVGELVVQGRGPRTGYAREQFGAAWADVDRNGCDTRNDVLRRDLTAPTFRAGTRDCVVLSGELAEPYTGRQVSFRKETAGDVQIDHVVALSDAWQKGAAQWAPATRLEFANDPLNLLAADGAANQAKGDGDTATWLPPNTAFRCRYVARQVAVKHRYALTVTAAERDAMVRVLTACPGEPAPGPAAPSLAQSTPTAASASPSPAAASAVPPSAAPTASPARTTPPAAPPTAVAPAAGADPDYGSCSSAIAHGAGPYRRGEPEYGYYRDADRDGTVCER